MFRSGIIIGGLVLCIVLGGVALTRQKAGSPMSRQEAIEAAAQTILENLIRERLKDPDSAQFSNLKLYDHGSGDYVLCGNVNARNSFGGYTGAEGFISTAVLTQEDGRLKMYDKDGYFIRLEHQNGDSEEEAYFRGLQIKYCHY